MKKICIITTQTSSINYWIRPFFEVYQSNGYDVTVMSTIPEEFKKTLPSYIKSKNIDMTRGVDIFGGLKAIWNMFWFFKKGRFDLVQYSTPNAAFYGSIASFFAGIKCRLYCQWGIRYEGFTGLKRKFFKIMEKIVCTLSTNISPDSQGNLEFDIKEGLASERKLHVIWNGSVKGVNLKEFNIEEKEINNEKIRLQYGINKTDFIFGFLGRILVDKGIIELIEAFLELYEKYDDIWLLIVGFFEKKESFPPEVLEKAEKCPRIVWTGRTTAPSEYYSAFDAFVFPSHREGFGGGVIQAAALGVPAIVSNIPPLLNSIKEDYSSLSFQVGSKDDLIIQMEKIYINNEMRREMGIRQSEFALNAFEESKFAEYYIEYRNQILSNNMRKDKE